MSCCEFVDKEKTFLDGTYCLMLNGKVHDTSIVKNYCDYSTRCVHCPHRGGDDRYRKEERKPERETERESKPERQEDDHRDRRGGGSGGGSGRSSGGGSGSGLIVGVLLALLAIVLLISELDIIKGHVNIKLNLPAGVNHKNIVMEAVSHDPQKDYKVYSKPLEKDGSGRVKVEKGGNSVYVSCDGAKMLVGPAISDGADELNRTDYSYEMMQRTMMCVLTIHLEDTTGQPIPAEKIELTAPDDDATGWINLSPGEFVSYIMNLPDKTAFPALTVTVEGYEPLTIQPDMSQRLVGLRLMLEPDAQQTGGGQK